MTMSPLRAPPPTILRHSSFSSFFIDCRPCQLSPQTSPRQLCNRFRRSISSPLCRSTSDNWSVHEFPSGCFLSNREQQPISSPAHPAFLAPLHDAYFAHFNCDDQASENASFQLEKSLVYQDLKGSLGRLDEHGRFFGTGSLPYARRSHIDYNCETSRRPCPKDVDPATPFHESKDSRKEDVKGTPMSLRILKRKHSKDKEIECQKRRMVVAVANTGPTLTRSGGDSVTGAFSCLILMIRTLLNHALQFSNDMQQVVSMVHMDMQESFLWLFQQVFSSTPKLMVLIMILLADFTVHSMGKYVALPVAMPLGEPLITASSVTTTFLQGGAMDIVKAFEGLAVVDDDSAGGIRIQIEDFERPSWPTAQNKEGNGGGGDQNIAGGQTDGYSWPGIPSASQSSAMYSKNDNCRRSVSVLKWDTGAGSACRDGMNPSDGSSATEDCLQASVSLDALEQETRQKFVAPVNVEVEPDDYVCYDRTDLNYQHAISMDPHNPLLLSNYAQFLYLVRHDHDRAEKMFRRATMAADPGDGEAMGRFASFLWVAKGDVAEADKAYRAALDAEPTNAFHAACYAHFLWDAGEQEMNGDVVNARA